MTCSPYDVVVVPFPFTDRRASKRRPALVLSVEKFNAETGHTMLAMITSANNSPWPSDVTIDAEGAGLQAPSKVRMKLFTLDNRLILHRAGSLDENGRQAVAQAMRQLFGGITLQI
ncbi:MAG: type II toxin-antitoxin system PemK/MazF family toxin [Candidatus Binataceae bacterium]